MLALEITSALLNGGYALGLAYRRRWAWPLGFLGTALSVAVLLDARLYAESLLNIVYALLALYGWFSWGVARRSRLGSRGASVLGAVLLGAITGLLMQQFTDNPRPYPDAALFAGGILGTWWQAERDRANWILWLVLNLIGVGLYLDQSLNVYALYSAVMAGISVWGWVRWKP
ncbi:MAG: nicotinamide mononucleotide transporter family protein [Schleiferiaceae bacterium]